jgi:hypothetical protein
MRDDFTKATKHALALRAGYICSFDGCDQLTAGPSDESADAVAVVGVAAHIHAASPGGPRRDEAMAPEQRRHIDNAVWLCSVHATLVDRDETRYSAAVLRDMKRRHEQQIAFRVARKDQRAGLELIALGNDVVFTGALESMGGSCWQIALSHFVVGDLPTLVAFSQNAMSLARADRFVLINELGDGRVLAAEPMWTKMSNGLLLTLTVESPMSRNSAQEIGADLALGPDDDLYTDLRLVSGVDALPQRIKLVLWHQKGQNKYSPQFGTRLAEYFHLFGTTHWFAQLVKLEAIRMASIPYEDEATRTRETPFGCVERIGEIQILESEPVNERLRARVRMTVRGVGEWTQELNLYVPTYPFADEQVELDALIAQARRP